MAADTAVQSRVTCGPGDADAAELLERSGRRIDVSDGHRVTVWRCWGAGPAVVLLHGGSGSWNHWVHNIAALAASHTVLVPDLPGYGDSGDLPPGTTLEELADIVLQALNTVLPGAEPVDLVAFSFGCIVAGQMAAAQPWRVGRLVLVGAVGLGIPRVGQKPLKSWRREPDPALRLQIQRDNLASQMIHDEAHIDALALRLHAHNLERTRFISKPISRSAALLERLREVDLPLFGIWGSGDVTASGRVQELGPLLQAKSPAAQFLVIEGAGHWVQYERPEAFNKALALLLQD